MIDRIRERMKEEGLELLVISDEENILWATGKELSGYVFLTQEELEAVLPRFYLYEDLDMFDDVSFCYKRSDYKETLDRKISEFSSMKAGIDEKSEKLEEGLSAERTDILKEMRKIKTDEEIDRIREACSITDEAFRNLKEDLFSGITEWEALGRLKQFYVEREVNESFLTNKDQSLVQANSMQPHREPKSREIEEDDLVIVDTGARYRKYCADVTRTYCRNPTEEQKKLFHDVKEVQKEMIELIEDGRPISEVKQRELEAFEQKGYNLEKNVLYYSHGIGVVAHEPPTVSHESDEEFKEGMVVTIEPGLHVEGLGGVRLEDTVLVKEEGAERLSKTPREL